MSCGTKRQKLGLRESHGPSRAWGAPKEPKRLFPSTVTWPANTGYWMCHVTRGNVQPGTAHTASHEPGMAHWHSTHSILQPSTAPWQGTHSTQQTWYSTLARHPPCPVSLVQHPASPAGHPQHPESPAWHPWHPVGLAQHPQHPVSPVGHPGKTPIAPCEPSAAPTAPCEAGTAPPGR